MKHKEPDGKEIEREADLIVKLQNEVMENDRLIHLKKLEYEHMRDQIKILKELNYSKD